MQTSELELVSDVTAWPMPRPRRRPARSPRPIAPGTRGATDLATRPGELDELELDQAGQADELEGAFVAPELDK